MLAQKWDTNFSLMINTKQTISPIPSSWTTGHIKLTQKKLSISNLFLPVWKPELNTCLMLDEESPCYAWIPHTQTVGTIAQLGDGSSDGTKHFFFFPDVWWNVRKWWTRLLAVKKMIFNHIFFFLQPYWRSLWILFLLSSQTVDKIRSKEMKLH